MRETDGGMERRWFRAESTKSGTTMMTRRGANSCRAGIDDRRDKSNEKGVVVVVIYSTPSVLIIKTGTSYHVHSLTSPNGYLSANAAGSTPTMDTTDYE